MSGPMSWRRRVAFAGFALAMSAMIGSAAFTTYRLGTRTATVTVCGRPYSVAAGSALTVSVGGPSCRDVKVSKG